MRIIADYFADAGRSVFFYNFNYDPAILKIVGLDTAHSLELPFVFGNAIGKMRISKISILSDQMQTHWTNFMKTGNPNTGGEYKNMMFWPFYNTRTRQLMVFDKELSNKTMPDADTLDFLQNLLASTFKKTRTWSSIPPSSATRSPEPWPKKPTRPAPETSASITATKNSAKSAIHTPTSTCLKKCPTGSWPSRTPWSKKAQP